MNLDGLERWTFRCEQCGPDHLLVYLASVGRVTSVVLRCTGCNRGGFVPLERLTRD